MRAALLNGNKNLNYYFAFGKRSEEAFQIRAASYKATFQIFITRYSAAVFGKVIRKALHKLFIANRSAEGIE